MDDQETANTLLLLDVVTSCVRDHLKLLSGKLLTSKDVHNLCQVASSYDTTEDELLKVLENCIGNDPTYTVSLIINEDDELELLYIQTSRMKKNGQELSWGAPHGLHVSLQQQKDATQYYDGHGWKWCLTKRKEKKSWLMPC